MSLINYLGESKVIRRICELLKVSDIQIDGVSIVDADGIADISAVAGARILMGTEAEWNAAPRLVAEVNTIYVYTDHDTYDGENIPAIKIGDGTSYLIDMAFVSDNTSVLFNHINDYVVHISASERNFWNNKVSCDESQIAQYERMILTTGGNENG